MVVRIRQARRGRSDYLSGCITVLLSVVLYIGWHVGPGVSSVPAFKCGDLDSRNDGLGGCRPNSVLSATPEERAAGRQRGERWFGRVRVFRELPCVVHLRCFEWAYHRSGLESSD